MSEFAVLVPLLQHEGEECILLTKRPESLSRYAGHVAFPGGGREAADVDLAGTALRETEEEVGLQGDRVEIVRELGEFETLREHRVVAYLGRVASPWSLRLNRAEVDFVLYLPRRRLRRDLFEVRGTFHDRHGVEQTIYTFDLDGHEVWGLTARILKSMTE